jgi:hypothetical protein
VAAGERHGRARNDAEHAVAEIILRIEHRDEATLLDD